MKAKKFLSTLLSLVLALSAVPALAEDETATPPEEETTTPAEDGIVYMTVSKQGILAIANDGSVMANKEVTVSDVNSDGFLTFDEALIAAHKEYNSEDGYSVPKGAVVKLWGEETQNTLFFVNGAGLSMGVKVDTVKEGDYLVASINKDGAPYYADWYTQFDFSEKEVEAKKEFVLNLQGHYGMAYTEEDIQFSPIGDVSVGIWEDGEFVALEDKKTDADGNVTLSFEEPGTYCVTANGTALKEVMDWSKYEATEYPCPIIAPFCEVTVTENKALTTLHNIAEKYSDEEILTDDENMLWFIADLGMYESLYPENEIFDDNLKQVLIDKIIAGVSEVEDKPADFAKAILALRALGFDASDIRTKENKKLDIVSKLEALVLDEDDSVKNIYTLPYVLMALEQGPQTCEEAAEILINVAIAQKDGWAEYGADGATPMILALSPYYPENEDVKAAIDENIEKIKEMQSETGAICSYGSDNAASTGLAIAALSALRMSVDEENGLLDGLMTLVAEDLSAFNPTINSFSTEQAFRGLLAWQLLENETGLRLYDFSEKEMNEANATLEEVEEEDDDDDKKSPGGSKGSNKTSHIQIAGAASTVTKQPTETENKAEEITFADVKKDVWYYDAVEYVSKNKIMSGTDKGFEPDTNMTRAMLVTVLYRIENSPSTVNELVFTDVPDGAWYADAVLWAKENGIIMGVSETEFAPDNNITREQLAAIMYRYAGFKGIDTSNKADISGFGDSRIVSEWAVDSVSWANASGLINGVGEGLLSPEGLATRAQTAQILMRFNSIK